MSKCYLDKVVEFYVTELNKFETQEIATALKLGQ